MKNNLLSATAVALALASGSAFAADLPSRKEAPVYVAPAPVATWTGFYAGVNLGGGWSSQGGNNSYLPYADSTFALGSVPPLSTTPNLFFLPGGGTTGNNTGGVVGGGQVGYNYQFGNSFVIGAETDIQGTSIAGGNQGNYAGLYASPYLGSATGVLSPLVTGNGGNLSLPWFGTVRGRAGYLATPTLLLYGTAGFAYGGVQAFQRSNTSTGWTAGGGVEWMFLPHWTAKLEYLYVDLDSSGVNGAYTGWQLGNNHHPQLNVVRVGVNYLFNFAAPAPVLAKY
ncbi:MAG: outer membrane beta-barrel protein [Methylocystis sp.]